MKLRALVIGYLLLAAVLPASAWAQCAGCNADFNRADRANVERQKQIERIEANDKPLRSDALGNGLFGGGLSAAREGARGVVTSIVKSVSLGEAGERARARRERN